MKNCPNCGIKANTERKTCPICFSPLNNIEENGTYEPYKGHSHKHKMNMSTKIFLFFTIITVGVLILVNYLTINKSEYYWSVISIASILYAWNFVKVLLLSRKNIVSRLAINAFLVAILLFIIDYFGSKNPTYWSLNYVTPFFILTTMIISVLIILIKKNLFIDSIISLLMLCLMGVTQFILYRYVDVVNIFWTSVMVIGASCILLIGMIIFQYSNFKDEIKKRFYF